MKEYLAPYPLTHPAWRVVRIAARHIHDRAERYLHGRVLDIGCGAKSKRHLIGHTVAEHIGLDHADSLHDLGSADLIGTAYEIPSHSEAFDGILCTAVLEHLEEPHSALAEAHRVLRPGGYAVYTVPLFWHLHEEPRDFYRYTSHGLRHLFQAAGFEVVEIHPMSGFLTTFATATNYYLTRFRRPPIGWISKPLIALNNLAMLALDRGILRDERFSWMYLVVVRKPQNG
jgi:SAM-dependent methyltransferase